MDLPLVSETTIVEEDPKARAFVVTPRSEAVFVGVTERGPVNTATRVTSYVEYATIFGAYTTNTLDMSAAVEGFFDEGGGACTIVRVVHYTNIAEAGTKSSVKADHTLETPSGEDTLFVQGKYDGAYANDLTIKVEPATSGDSDKFKLTVLDNGIILAGEVYDELSMIDAADRYVETIINDPDIGSKYIAVTDLDALGQSPYTADARPKGAAITGGFTSPVLSGGNDGISGLVAADYYGSALSDTGFRALDTIDDITILCVPGRGDYATHDAMITYCEVTRARAMIAILDPAVSTSASAMKSYITSNSLWQRSEHGVAYWPRIKVLNPSKTLYGNTAQLTIAPSGHIAGLWARVDQEKEGGYATPPAGKENGRLRKAVGVETTEVQNKEKRKLVFPLGVNPIVKDKRGFVFVDGSRTLKDNGNFPTVGERRVATFIEQTAFTYLDDSWRHKNNDYDQRQKVKTDLDVFLYGETQKGVFRSREPGMAYFVDVSNTLNPASIVFARQGKVRIGIATQKPTEKISLLVGQNTRDLDTEIQRALS